MRASADDNGEDQQLVYGELGQPRHDRMQNRLQYGGHVMFQRRDILGVSWLL